MGRKFGHFLREVEHGRAIQIHKRGKTVARLVPDCDFMDGWRAAALFDDQLPDPATADAIALEISKLKPERQSRPASSRRSLK